MPSRVKITADELPSLTCPPGKASLVHWDSELKGFGVRAYKSGRRVWIVQYRDKVGKQGKATLGDLTTVKPAEAREKARTLLAGVQLGGNPGDELQARREADRVIDLIEAYLPKAKAKLKARSYEEVERALRKGAVSLHFKKADAVKRADIVRLIDRVASGDEKQPPKPVAANRLRAHLSALWAWGMRAGRVHAGNPVALTEVAVREVPRDRLVDKHATGTPLAG